MFRNLIPRPSARRRAAVLSAAASVAVVVAAVPSAHAGVPSRAEPAFAATSAPRAAAAAVTPVPLSRTRLTAALVVRGLVDPLMVTSANDGTSRLFVVERAGRVRTVLGRRITGSFLDIRRLVLSGGERGLLGLAFAPDFARSHLVWVTYTRGDGALVLARFSTSSATASTVRSASRRTVLVVPHPSYGNHNGGYIGFGPDGYLYLGTGDGGSAGDPRNNAQNVRSLLGKMLRINVRCAGRLYCSPLTNPYVRSTTARHEIWMIGLRNPWRWSFDITGVQWIGDVGQDRYEEIDAVTPSAARASNLGWSCREGKHVYNASRCRSTVRYTSPVVELCHADSVSPCPTARAAEAIIGGFVYRGSAYPAFRGTYVLGDYVTGRIWPLRGAALGAPSGLAGVSGFGIDDRREIYAVSLNGGLYRIGFRAV
jgi:glucose/arabinose dehydrogenase